MEHLLPESFPKNKKSKNLVVKFKECSATWLKCPISYLRQFRAIESPLKMMKNALDFMLKALFVLEISKFSSWIFGYVKKRLSGQKLLVNYKIYDVKNWVTNNRNTHNINISRSKGTQAMKFGQLINYSVRNILLQKPRRNWGRETSSRHLFVFLKGFI